MAEKEKKRVVINRGQRTFHLKPGPKGEERALPPGGAVECLDEAEYTQLMGHFREIADADKLIPTSKDREAELEKQVDALQKEVDRLTDENERLEKLAGKGANKGKGSGE